VSGKDDEREVKLPRETTAFFGHAETEQALLASYQSGRVPHAWLIGGPPGIGKATLAYRFARFVLANPEPQTPRVAQATSLAVDPDASVSRRIAAQAQGDLLALERVINEQTGKLYTVIRVDDVRRTISFFGATAGEGGWRVCIVDTADDLNNSAANALLKVLEEPPERTLFFVLAHSPRGLLPTIRSRCQKMDIRPLAAADVAEAMDLLGVAEDVAANDRELVAQLSAGSVRRAILLARGDGIDLYRRLCSLAENPARPDRTAIHALAGEISPANRDDRYRLFLDLAHDFIARRVRGEAEPADGKRAGAGEGISVLARWVEVWEKTRHSADLADAYNLDRKQVILNLFEAMREAA
jgi:DNA polymerase-3 subunit delta'